MKQTLTWLSLSLGMALLTLSGSALGDVPLQRVNQFWILDCRFWINPGHKGTGLKDFRLPILDLLGSQAGALVRTGHEPEQSSPNPKSKIQNLKSPVNPDANQGTDIPLQPVNSNAGQVTDVSLRPVNPDTDRATLDSLGLDEQLWRRPGQPGDRQALLRSIDYSLRYLASPAAAQAYQRYPVPGITRDRVRRSLVRFRQLVVTARSPAQLQAAVKREFVFYKSVGKDNQGTVLFTGYFEPIYVASRKPSAEYRYPLYRLPKDFDRWPMPHPTRPQLEGEDGLGTNSPLKGQELVWLRDRLEAFLVQVEGSAQLRMPDGKIMTVGYAGKTKYPYVSVGRELVKDGKLPLEGLTLPVLINYFRSFPGELNQYLSRNQNFVFFKETHGEQASGSIGVPVTAERSIATDKSLMPPGALALINAPIPVPNAGGQLASGMVNRYVLDQDTGSAIKGAGRVDIFMGTGPRAGDRAGIINGSGELYYLLIKD